MGKVTIVCCYNDMLQFNELKRTLAKQDVPYELIGINNCKNKFSSCSCALNSVLKNIASKFVIFSHQDIRFQNEKQLGEFVNYLEKLEYGDILGVAGRKKGVNGTITNIMHGSPLRKAGKIRLSKMLEGDTIDECFFGGHTAWFKENFFNEILCNNWHLYAVERCLYTRTMKKKVYICDVELIHLSGGNPNHAFVCNFYKICEAYSHKIDEIWTTCAHSKTAFFYRVLSFIKYEFKIWMKRCLIK
uniref:glycosyltransferase n=1 Tax=Agathobacter sp. TaxID=2021311 RepID=UPI004057C7AC